MIGLLIKLLGGHLEQAGRIVRVHLTSGGGIGPAWILILSFLLIAATFLSYRRTAEMVSTTRRSLLTGLRSVFFILLLLMLARPILSLTVQGTIRRTLLFLVDVSRSMTIQDPRIDEADKKRAAIATGALDALKGLDQPLSAGPAGSGRPSRLDLVKNAFSNPQFKLLDDLGKDFDLEAYSFADEVRPVPIPRAPNSGSPFAALAAAGGSTAIGDAIRDVLRQKRGQPLAGIILMTDGGNNRGTPPREAAQLAADQAAPLFAYGAGVTSPRDIIVSNVFAEPVAFSNDELPVSVRIRAYGMIGQTVPLVLRLGDKTVAQRDITIDHDGETVVTTHFVPDAPGEGELLATVPPREDEAVKDNNTAGQHLRVIDGKIKVLYVDSAPRWDFKYLQAMLLRDRRISPKFVLSEGDPGISKAAGSPYLPAIPTDRNELFRYNLIILGDVAPAALSADQQALLDEFVAKLGGAIIFLAGQNHNPADYLGAPLEKMLPVVPRKRSEPSDLTKPIALQLTPAGTFNAMLSLSDDDAESKREWGAFPPVYWTAPIEKAKAGAQILLVDPDTAKASRAGPMPVMALQSYGLGQVLFLGTDETWRWRRNELVPLHDALWSQVIQRLGLPNLLGLSQKVQLTSDKQKYAAGDRVTVYARVYGDNFEPLSADAIKGSFAAASGVATPVTLHAVPDQPGLFKSEFLVPSAGSYDFTLEKSPEKKLRFDVEDPKVEMGDTAMNEPMLKEISAATGGQFFREENLANLPGAVRAKAAEVRSTLEVELWSSPLFYLLLLGVVSTEWILRKTAQLK